MTYTILQRDELPHHENIYEFQGMHYPDTDVSFIWVDMPPGGTIRLHKHPYQEIFIIQEGVATFTVGSASLQAQAGQIILVPAAVPHKFMNLSDQRLRQIDIHLSRQFITDWLDDEVK